MSEFTKSPPRMGTLHWSCHRGYDTREGESLPHLQVVITEVDDNYEPNGREHPIDLLATPPDDALDALERGIDWTSSESHALSDLLTHGMDLMQALDVISAWRWETPQNDELADASLEEGPTVLRPPTPDHIVVGEAMIADTATACVAFPDGQGRFIVVTLEERVWTDSAGHTDLLPINTVLRLPPARVRKGGISDRTIPEPDIE